MSRPEPVVPASSSNLLILDRLEEITNELVEVHGELADLERANLEGRAQAFATAAANQIGGRDSVAGRERHADIAMLDLDTEITVLKGRRSALIEEREWCRVLLGLPEPSRR